MNPYQPADRQNEDDIPLEDMEELTNESEDEE